MRTRILLGLVLLISSFALATQTMVTVTSSYIMDSAQNLLANGVIKFAPTDCAGNPLQYHIGGGGFAISRPVVAFIVNGAITTQVNGTTVKIVDTSATAPQNVCFDVTITDTQAMYTFPTIHGVQPAASNAWCNSGVCNWDNYAPSITTLPLYGGSTSSTYTLPVATASILGGVKAPNCTALGSGYYPQSLNNDGTWNCVQPSVSGVGATSYTGVTQSTTPNVIQESGSPILPQDIDTVSARNGALTIEVTRAELAEVALGNGMAVEVARAEAAEASMQTTANNAMPCTGTGTSKVCTSSGSITAGTSVSSPQFCIASSCLTAWYTLPSVIPTGTTIPYAQVTGTPVLAAVATSGSYNDLSNKPTIPAAQVAANLANSGSTGVTGTLPASQVGSGYPYANVSGTPALNAAATATASGTKCYPYAGSGGAGCDTPAGGSSTVTTFWELGPDASSSYTASQPIFFLSGSNAVAVPTALTFPTNGTTGSTFVSTCNLGNLPTAAWTVTFYSVASTTAGCTGAWTSFGTDTINTTGAETWSLTQTTIPVKGCFGAKAQSTVDTTAAYLHCALVVQKSVN